MNACAKCGSTSLIRTAQVDRVQSPNGMARDVTVRVNQDPQALLLKEPVTGMLRPVICGSCGYVEFYVPNPHELLAAEQAALRRKH